MPVDLDDLYASLARQADTVPLGGADSARRRGKQRRRTRSMIAAAAAVCLVGGGVAWVARPGPEQSPPASSTTLTEIGSPRSLGVRSPDDLPEVTMIVENVAYTGWREASGEVKISALDLRTGRPVWPTRSLGRLAGFENIVVVPGTLLVKVHVDAGRPRPAMHVFDTATGRQRPYITDPTEQTLVYGRGTLINKIGGTGRLWATDAATGRILWDETTTNVPVDRTIGMTITASGDDDRPPAAQVTYFSGNRILQADKKGQLMIRDAGTGKLLETRSAGSNAPEKLILHDYRIYSVQQEQPDRVQVIDLDGGPGGVIRLPAGREVQDLQPCGEDRVCVLDRSEDAPGRLTVYQGATRQKIWQVEAPKGATEVSSRKGRLLVGGSAVFSAGGKQLFRAEEEGRQYRWLDDQHLIDVPVWQSGPVVTVTVATGRKRVLGTLDQPIGSYCSIAPERLLCNEDGELRLYDISG